MIKESKKIKGDGGLFIATWLPKDVLKAFDHIEGLDDILHMTILYLDEGIDTDYDREKVLEIAEYICKNTPPIKCELTEIGIMGNEEGSMVANVTAKNGAKFYSNFVTVIEDMLKKELNRTFDFLPHVTLKFKNRNKTVNIKDLRKFKWKMDEITVQFGDEKSHKYRFGLTGES